MPIQITYQFRRLALISFVLPLLWACSTPRMPSNVTPTRIATPDKVDDMQPMLVPNRVVGSDRDAKGCIPSAGYSWCERTKACERPWELASSEGFKPTEYNFGAWCNFKETK